MEVMTGKNDHVGVGVGVAAESSPRLLSLWEPAPARVDAAWTVATTGMVGVGMVTGAVGVGVGVVE
jgi:hypothetical protein